MSAKVVLKLTATVRFSGNPPFTDTRRPVGEISGISSADSQHSMIPRSISRVLESQAMVQSCCLTQHDKGD